jgi:hypothetical protein
VLAHAAPLPDVAHALAAPGRVTVLLAAGAPPFALRERDAGAKVEALIKRGLYPTALALLSAEGAPPAALADVRRRFGDHLASKRDFEGALAQWIGTIDGGAPRHATSSRRCWTRAAPLTWRGSWRRCTPPAPPARSTPRCCCTATRRPKTRRSWTRFWRRARPRPRSRRRFDVPTVLRVCRAAGYPHAALAAAARAGDAGTRLEILMDDLNAPDQALSLLETLPPGDADAGLRRYGRRLLAARPAAAAALLLRGVQRGGAGGLARAAAAAPLFAERPRALLRFLQAALEACGGAGGGGDAPAPAEAAAAAALHATLLELLLAERLPEDAGAPDAPPGVARRGGGGGGGGGGARRRCAAPAARRMGIRPPRATTRRTRWCCCQSAAAAAAAAAAEPAGAAAPAPLRARAERVRALLPLLAGAPAGCTRSCCAATPPPATRAGCWTRAQRLGARADAALWREALGAPGGCHARRRRARRRRRRGRFRWRACG